MSITVRSIRPDEGIAFRRAFSAGFHNADTVDDAEWVAAVFDPIERVLAAFDGESIVATYQSFPTELTVPGGRTVPAGAVTAVSTRATHRRRGLLTQMMTTDLAASRDQGEVADVLIAAEYPIYGRFGYGPSVPSVSWELDARSARFVPLGEGTVAFVDNDDFRKEAPAIFERVRAARPGMIGRSDLDWDVRADLRRRPEGKPWEGFRVICADDAGVPQGWANYTITSKWVDMRPHSIAEVADMCATTPAAEAQLWRFLVDLDHVSTVKAGDRPVDDLLPWLLEDARVARQTARLDFVWARLLDVPAALEARSYGTTGRVVLEVTDPQGLAAGRYVLDASPEGASCRPTTETVNLTMSVRTLSTAYLGGVGLTSLHAAGWLDEHTPGAVATADVLLSTPVAPWCNTWF